MPNKSSITADLLKTLFCSYALAVLAIGPAHSQTQLLNSFESTSDLAKVSTVNAAFSHTKLDATNGSYALQVNYLPKAGAAVTVAAPTGGWSLANYSGIAIDVTNPGSTDVELTIAIGDTAAASSTNAALNTYDIPAGQSISIADELSQNYTPQWDQQGMQTSPLWFPGYVANYSWNAPSNYSSASIYYVSLYPASVSSSQTLIFDNVRAISSVTWPNYYVGFVDSYGQFNRMDWGGKVNSTADFATNESAEKSDLAANPASPANWDTYGGWSAGPREKATGYFYTAEVNGKWWFVDPLGYLFYSTGIDDITSDQSTIVSGRTQMFTALPSESSGTINGLGNGAGWTINANAYKNPPGPSISNNAAVLTNGASNFTSASIFYDTPVNIGNNWTVNFTYVSGGGLGVAFVLQNDSLKAQGSSNTGLGYAIDPNFNNGGSQITKSAAVELLGWDVNNGGGSGTSFDTTATALAATGESSSDVYYSNGTLNGIILDYKTTNVTLQYSSANNSITETLTQGSNTFTCVFTNVNLTAAVGSGTAWMGFTGSCGGGSSVNEITNFSYVQTGVANPTENFYTDDMAQRYGPNYLSVWTAKTYKRLKSWGFNTVGVWSDATFTTSAQLPYIVGLYTYNGFGSLGNYNTTSVAGYPSATMPDPFDPIYAETVNGEFQKEMAGKSADPLLIGYYADSELTWEGPTGPMSAYGLPVAILSQNASSSPAKQAFVTSLTAEYGTVAKLNAAWGATFASWAALDAPYSVPAQTKAAQLSDLSSMLSLYATQYFKVIRGAIKSIDPNHLYLGCKFEYLPPGPVLTAAEASCDVLSYDIYSPTINNFSSFAGSAKPVISAEFQFGAQDTGLFFNSLGPTVDQESRAKAFSAYANSAISNPYVIGYQWFDYTDEPLTGRIGDLENGNIGFVSVTDTVYQDLVNAARSVQSDLYSTRY